MLAGRLEIEIATGVARLQQDMQQVRGIVGTTMADVNRMVGETKTLLAGLGVGLSAGFFVGLVKGSIDAMDHLGDLSKVTRISAEDLAGLGYAARASGSDMESAAKSAATLTVNMGKGAEKFGALGVSARDPIEAMKQLADVTNAIADPQMRAAVLAEALGKNWQAAAPLLAEGSAKIGELVERGKQLSGVTEANVRAADDLNDKLHELAGNGGALNATVGASLPLLNTLADDLLAWRRETGGVTEGSKALAEALRALIVLGGNVSFVIKGIGTEIGGLYAQQAALLHGDFGRFIEIGREMKADAEAGRAAFDAWEARIMAVGTAAKASGSALDAMDQVQRRMAQEAAAQAREFLEFEKRKRDAEAAAKKAIEDAQRARVENAEAELKADQMFAQDFAEAWHFADLAREKDDKQSHDERMAMMKAEIDANEMAAQDFADAWSYYAQFQIKQQKDAAAEFESTWGHAIDTLSDALVDLAFNGRRALDSLKASGQRVAASFLSSFARNMVSNGGDIGGSASSAGASAFAQSPMLQLAFTNPITTAIAAVYLLYETFKDKGENWQGQLGFGANAHAYTTNGVFGQEGFNFVQGQDATNRQMQAFFASTGGIDRSLASGLTPDQIATITQNLGGSYTTRNDGQPSTFAFGQGDSTAAQQFTLEYLQKKYGTIFDTIDKTFADFIRSYTGDSQGLLTEIGDFAAVMEALKDSPVPGLSLESLRNMQHEGEKLSDTFNRIAAGWADYVSNFYSQDEQQAMGFQMLQHQLDQFGVTLPKTREEFRHLVETTEVGSPLWEALMAMAGAFAQLVPAADAATNAVGGTTNALGRTDSHVFGSSGSRYGMPGDDGNTSNSPSQEWIDAWNRQMAQQQDLGGWLSGALTSNLSPLSPGEQLEAARQAWIASPTAANSTAYLDIARQLYGSSSAYGSIFHQVYDTNAGIVGAPDYNTRMEQIQSGMLGESRQQTHTLSLILEGITTTNSLLSTGTSTPTAQEVELR